MLKIALMGNINQELQQELIREYSSNKYEKYIRMIMHDIYKELNLDVLKAYNFNFHVELREVTVLVINEIWLDNVMRYIITSTIHKFISLIQNNQLWQDIFINWFYVNQISEIVAKYFHINAEEISSITDIVIVRLKKIMIGMYQNNNERYNQILLTLLQNIYDLVRNIRFKYYKFGLDHYCRPLIFYTERDQDDEYFSHQ